MRRFIIALAAMAVMAAGCQEKPVEPMKPKVGAEIALLAI